MVWVVCVRGGVQPPRPLLRLLPLPHPEAATSGALANVAANARSLRFPAKLKDFLVGHLKFKIRIYSIYFFLVGNR